jgi:hypothetical protein
MIQSRPDYIGAAFLCTECTLRADGNAGITPNLRAFF